MLYKNTKLNNCYLTLSDNLRISSINCDVRARNVSDKTDQTDRVVAGRVQDMENPTIYMRTGFKSENVYP